MNVAGPSRVQPSGRLASRGRVESTYEDDLLGLLNHLSLDEMDEIQSFFTLRTRAGHPMSDHEVAMNDLLQQSRALAVLNQDRALAQRIAIGEDVTGQTPEQRPVPAVARPDGNGTAAQRNDRQQDPERPDARSDTAPSQTWGGWLSSVVDWVCGTEPTNADTAVPRIPVVNRPTGHDCVICQDPIYGAEIRAPCGHYYGIDCITDLFQSATRDETLFPPRCCRQNIPFAQVQLHLSQELITTFQQKQVEFSTLKRVYCSSPPCSHFLGPISEGFFDSKVYTCPAPGCREQHSSNWTHTCRPDTDAAQVLELGRASGWARCPGCSQLIELHIGCFHMTCRCRTEFCYLCRARWKTCPCPQWDERRLMVAAEERVDAQLGAGRARGARRHVPPVPVPIVIPANRAPAPAPVPAQMPVPARPVAPPRPLAPGVETRHPPPIPARGARRDVPPVPVPNPIVIPANRTPAPAPVPAQMPVPAQPVAPPRPLAPGVETRHPPPIPARTPTTSSWTGTDHTWRSRLAAASTTPTNTGTAAQASASGWRSSMASVTTSGVASASASTSASASSSASPTALASGSGWRARMASEPEWRARMAPEPEWRARTASTTTSGLASGSTLTKTSTSASTPSATRPKSIQNDDIDQMRRRLVHEMMDRLREDHECDHTRWRYRRGGGVCQTCGHHLPLYLFQCQGCEILACKQCKCNRL
ncbi:hypothetical protein EV363DRAFT_1316699 [Boletus edulis]|nr:hypothetical protein EV363DRAFT_1316699 [Boletus edulis]